MFFPAVHQNRVGRCPNKSSRQICLNPGWIVDSLKYLHERNAWPIVLFQSSRFMQPFFIVRYPTAFFAQKFGVFNDIIELFKFLRDVILYPFTKSFFFFSILFLHCKDQLSVRSDFFYPQLNDELENTSHK